MKEKLNSISTGYSEWIKEAEKRQLQRKRWGVFWNYRIKILIKYYRLKRYLLSLHHAKTNKAIKQV